MHAPICRRPELIVFFFNLLLSANALSCSAGGRPDQDTHNLFQYQCPSAGGIWAGPASDTLEAHQGTTMLWIE